jgi:NAD(P)-dependent dehydrogenase (short-subunit alcohol dehydrogenase family)
LRDLYSRRVLITGAASGIGRGAALAFAREGSRLLLVDINGDGLEELEKELKLRGTDCRSYLADVASEDAVRELAASVEADVGGVDVLVNVAGVCVVADVVDTPLEDWRWIIGVNLWGPVHTVHAFLPGMIERGSGHIVNVSSAGGLVSFGLIASYSTTKFALVGFSEALGQEVWQHGIGVTAFCPGVTGTPIVRSMRFHGYSRDAMLKFWDRLMSSRAVVSAEKTGELIVLAVKKEKPLVVTSRPAKILVLLNRLFPGVIRFTMRRGKMLNERLYR